MSFTDAGNSALLLHKLCCHITGLPPGAVSEAYDIALHSIATATTAVEKETLPISELIVRSFIQAHKEAEAVKFSDLLRKLHAPHVQGVLKNPSSVLSFLYHLSEAQSKLTAPGFGLPRLGSQVERRQRHQHAVDETGDRTSGSLESLSHKSRPSTKSSNQFLGLSTQVEGTMPVSGDELITEVLYAFQGIGGKILHFDEVKECFVFNPKVSLPQPTQTLVLRLVELGCLYRKVNAFCESKSGGCKSGLMPESFVAAIRTELSEYYRFVAVLDSQHRDNFEDGGSKLTLLRLRLWAMEPMKKMRVLAALVAACAELKGGMLASKVHAFLHHGGREVVALVKRLLIAVVKPWQTMLCRWIHTGELEDVYHEFFIASNAPVKPESLWHDKYYLRKNMVPSFLAESQARKILCTGKAVNFLLHVCGDSTAARMEGSIASTLGASSVQLLFDQDTDEAFDEFLDKIYRERSRRVLSVLNSQFKFKEHLQAFRQFFLLGQGDFVRHLMDVLNPHLSQPVESLHQHTLTELLSEAVRATNAQFIDQDILQRLDAKLLEVNPGDTGWDAFSLYYHVDGPIGTVFTPYCMSVYLRLFNHLWRAKHMEYVATAAWTEQTVHMKLLRYRLPECLPVLHRCHLMLAEMMHFMQEVQYYIVFEVIECAWAELQTKVEHAQDLDQIIKAHEEFLSTIMTRALLDTDSRDVLSELRSIFEQVLRFKQVQDEIFSGALKEIDARAEEKKHPAVVTRTSFVRAILKSQSSLTLISDTFERFVEHFLLSLANQSDGNLQGLGFRLDFNEYYKGHNSQLRTSMTFQNKKQTMRSDSQGEDVLDRILGRRLSSIHCSSPIFKS
ncbi:gamma-tubulin complex component 3-like isoform X2 [Ornithodoros turicata]|uniref:gamma-tubulin complex component 3-like isoform X2 n=1 Tax=Ornithodoros turicata TaxID=34597 RepID=UPI0031399A04